MNIKLNKTIFYFTAFICAFILFLKHPIIQDENYHLFAEQRNIFSIPHIGDVVSNLSFIIVGFLLLFKKITKTYYGQNFLYYFFAFSCISLGFGSGYYHWNPNDQTLFWDRFTMLLGFSIIFVDSCIRFSIFSKNNTTIIFLISSMLFLDTSIYWLFYKDLSPYVFAQFFTMFSFIILSIINRKNIFVKHIFLMTIWYFVAKICENQDKQIFSLLGDLISGHTLKHIAYALSLWYFGKDMCQIQIKSHNN